MIDGAHAVSGDAAAAASSGTTIDPTPDATVAMLVARCGLPRNEALRLLAHASGATRERLIAGSHDTLPSPVIATFAALAARRRAGEPIAYLTGQRAFYGRAFAVDERVLIPRPETELLVEHALRWIDARTSATDSRAGDLRILDLGTGSGAIAISLALERPALEVVATDRSAAALAVARDNAARLGAVIRFAAGDWFDALPGEPAFDVVVANPPYVAPDDPHLAAGDLRFEPRTALTDGDDGLGALRRIVAAAPARLVAGGLLAVEHGYRHGADTRALFVAAGFVEVASSHDLAGIERITFGTRAA